jgi:hypothetical protein
VHLSDEAGRAADAATPPLKNNVPFFLLQMNVHWGRGDFELLQRYLIDIYLNINSNPVAVLYKIF